MYPPFAQPFHYSLPHKILLQCPSLFPHQAAADVETRKLREEKIHEFRVAAEARRLAASVRDELDRSEAKADREEARLQRVERAAEREADREQARLDRTERAEALVVQREQLALQTESFALQGESLKAQLAQTLLQNTAMMKSFQK